MTVTLSDFILTRPPETDDELYELVWTLWNIRIPRTQVCAEHQTPFQAFADAYFGRSPVAVWKGSRGFGGKSRTLAYLSLTEAVVMGAEINLLGGSLAQSTNIHEAMRDGWDAPLAPNHMVVSHGTTVLRLTNGAKVRPLTASQRTVRGPHPQRLRLDEIDEMDLAILDAAMGQPMPKTIGDTYIDTQTVMSSTHQYPDKTMTEMLVRAVENDWPVYSWCYKETSNSVDGWLSPATIERKRQEVSAAMFAVEYDLQEPSIGTRAIDTEAVEKMFSLNNSEVIKSPFMRRAGVKEVYEFEQPMRDGDYITGADWAKEQDYTVITTWRTDCKPWRLVAYRRFNRRPWPVMVGWFNEQFHKYGGKACHDGTGVGNVVNDYIDSRSIPFIMAGRQRDEMLTEYIAAVERGELIAPRIESAYTAHKYCVAEGSLVWTFNGSKPIEQIKVGDVVRTRKGWRTVKSVWNNGVRYVHRLRTSDGKEVLLTEDHSIATARGWVEARLLEPGDVLFVGDTDTATTTPVGDNEVGTVVRMPVGAMSNSSPLCSDAITPQDVHALSDGFQVVRADAVSYPAQMIDHESVRDRSDEDLVGATVGYSPSHLSVAQMINVSSPFPAIGEDVHLAPVEEVLTVDNHRTAHVLDCSPTYEIRTVWDIEVEEDHEFYANGIVVHNCSTEDVYGGGKEAHLPDEVCSMALAWHLSKRKRIKAMPIMVGRQLGDTQDWEEPREAKQSPYRDIGGKVIPEEVGFSFTA